MLMEGLYNLLQNTTALNAIVGTRVFVSVLPKQYVVPAITFSRVSGYSNPALDKSNVLTTSVDINSWAKTYSDAAKAMDAIQAKLNMYQGTLSDGTVVLYAQGNTDSDQYEPDSLLYRCTATFVIQHT